MKNNTKIYFVRHGQTDRNVEGRMNPGDIDSELNKIGINQAIEAGKKAKKEGLYFDIIISSPLKRAYKTAEIIAKQIGYTKEVLIDERLKEQLAGKIKNYTHTELKAQFNLESTEEVRKFFKDKKNNGAEDITNFIKRVIQCYDEIIQDYFGKNILLVGHSGVIRPILIQSLGLDPEYAIYKMSGVPNSVIFDIEKFETK